MRVQASVKRLCRNCKIIRQIGHSVSSRSSEMALIRFRFSMMAMLPEARHPERSQRRCWHGRYQEH